MIKLKNKFNYYTIILICMLFLGVGGYHMYEQQYQMAVIVPADNENDPEWPSKRIWFDASEWLKSSQYVKIDDFYILNTKYTPVDDINIFGVTRRLQYAINNSIKNNPELSDLYDMDEIQFFKLMKGNLSYEYLRTEFNPKTLKPTEDYFLVFFSYRGRKYEVELLRTNYKAGYIFMVYDNKVNKAGYWHSISPVQYSYSDYIKGKNIE